MNRSIRLLAGGFLLSATTILVACGSSDPAPSQSDVVTTTTEAMTDKGDSMTSTTEAMSDEGKDGSMSDGTTTTEAMADEGDSMTSTTEAMSDEGKNGSMSDGDEGDAMDDGTDQG